MIGVTKKRIFDSRVEILKQMKGDYLFIRERILECEKNAPAGVQLAFPTAHCDECIRLLDILIKSYVRKISRG